ncbi:hypothetical protein FB567DRAFT_331414 [Paraphoma chrysanthemicola]|uniref:Uncharacterized protein n=1 Tax=Paraphoma chrysanthemicola TaxID=798071 RepID=A0A8K0R7B4_9PLEO|nr:hypothetical protein FB567DRAFT_331414 [Paraphoma chrysanthemicola]
MAGSLLRHIFRHGTRRSTHVISAHHVGAQPLQNQQQTSPLKRVLTEDDLPDSPLAYEPRSESRQSSVLEDIAEECNNDKEPEIELEVAGEIERTFINETLAALDLDISKFTSRDLILSSVDEARLAILSHIDTINTTLAVLDAFDGFSATIALLKVEMVEKNKACEEKLAMLEHVEWAVGQMQLGEE